MGELRKAIAIDFDGCLCERAWPGIGEPHIDVIQAAIQEKENGAALILWTCRVDKQLGEAVKFCADLGLTFDAVNANLPERIAAYQNDCRKVNADEYWDDQAVKMPSTAQEHPINLRKIHWKGCEWCRGKEGGLQDFCYSCGRPLTKDAWVKLYHTLKGGK